MRQPGKAGCLHVCRGDAGIRRGAHLRTRQQAAQASDQATKDTLSQTSESSLVFPSQAEFGKTHYYRILNGSEATQWNDIFNAVILG